MWLTLLRKAEFKPFAQILSPSFFDAVPVRVLVQELTGLVTRYRDKLEFEQAKLLRARALTQARLPLRIADSVTTSGLAPQTGEVVLELYFHQVLSGGAMLLDLRAETFMRRNGELWWAPSPVYETFAADFVAGVASLYRGYYYDDPATFEQGARQLGLERITSALHQHFADAASTPVRFSLREFQRRFAAIFAACKETRSQLHPGFIPFGIGLATLYSHLERYDTAFDVTGAFVRADAALDRATSDPARLFQ